MERASRFEYVPAGSSGARGERKFVGPGPASSRGPAHLLPGSLPRGRQPHAALPLMNPRALQDA